MGGVAAGSPSASGARASRFMPSTMFSVCLAGMGCDVGNTIGTGSVLVRWPVTGLTV